LKISNRLMSDYYTEQQNRIDLYPEKARDLENQGKEWQKTLPKGKPPANYT
jgi:hypothetical protein